MSMDIYEEYFMKYKHELEQRTGTYCSYSRGFMIFYRDEQMHDTIVQFNLARIATRYALNSTLMDFQYQVVTMMKQGMFFKTAGEL